MFAFWGEVKYLLYTNEEIALIKKSIDIKDEISKYIVLTKKASKYLGTCPFHDDKNSSFQINLEKQLFKCWGCGLGGDVFRFIQQYMKFNFVTAVQYLILTNQLELDKFGYSGQGNVYILKLEGDKYYIGYTEDLEKRLQKHFSGTGAEWTKENMPTEVFEVYNGVNLKFENDLTELYMKMYGYRVVRGGDFPFRKVDFSEVKEKIRNRTKEGVFILLLQDNKYYIGYGVNLDKEIEKHYKGMASEWTQKYKPIKTLKIIRTRRVEECKDITLEFIEKYGWENVRGDCWNRINSFRPIIAK
jgi:predicted GIY-YIG superfamily endonuclease